MPYTASLFPRVGTMLFWRKHPARGIVFRAERGRGYHVWWDRNIGNEWVSSYTILRRCNCSKISALHWEIEAW